MEKNHNEIIKTIILIIKNNLFYIISIALFMLCILMVHTNAILIKDIDENNIIEIQETTNDTTFETEEVQESEEIKPNIYIAKEQDTFWEISKNEYGSGIYFEAIMFYNEYSSDKDLKIGDEIILPSIEDENFIEIFNTLEEQHKIETEEFGQTSSEMIMKAGKNPNGYKYGIRQNPAVDIKVPNVTESMKNNTSIIDTSGFTLVGKYSTTGYTPGCQHCCGNTKGIGASGVPVICGYSVAAPSNIPLGTTLYIEGYGFYVVEDRGAFGKSNIDIACPSHESCAYVTNTEKNINVYIVPNN